MGAALFADIAAILLVFGFALTLGAQAFDTFVNVPVFFSDPPRSIADYRTWPTSERVPLYFVRAMVLVILGILAATGALFVHRGSFALVAADICALVYIALVFLVFVPINRRLGFLPGGKEAEAGDTPRLARHWRTWNAVRLFVQALGLGAAAVSLAASSGRP